MDTNKLKRNHIRKITVSAIFIAEQTKLTINTSYNSNHLPHPCQLSMLQVIHSFILIIVCCSFRGRVGPTLPCLSAETHWVDTIRAALIVVIDMLTQVRLWRSNNISINRDKNCVVTAQLVFQNSRWWRYAGARPHDEPAQPPVSKRCPWQHGQRFIINTNAMRSSVKAFRNHYYCRRNRSIEWSIFLMFGTNPQYKCSPIRNESSTERYFSIAKYEVLAVGWLRDYTSPWLHWLVHEGDRNINGNVTSTRTSAVAVGPNRRQSAPSHAKLKGHSYEIWPPVFLVRSQT